MSLPHGPAAAEEHHDEIHLPGPSWWPLTMALGISSLLTGLVVSPVLLGVGVLLSLTSLGLWVRDARGEYRALHD